MNMNDKITVTALTPGTKVTITAIATLLLAAAAGYAMRATHDTPYGAAVEMAAPALQEAATLGVCQQVWQGTPIRVVDTQDVNCALRMRRAALTGCPADPTAGSCVPCALDSGYCEAGPSPGDTHAET